MRTDLISQRLKESPGGKIFKFYAWQKKLSEFLRHITLINGNGIEWVDKCKLDIYYGEQRTASVYSSSDLLVVMLCRRMCGALFIAVLLADKVQLKN